METRTFIEHPRCAILRSPEKLDTSSTSPGQDKTNTRDDFDKVWEWLKSSNFLNTEFCPATQGRQLQNTVYKPQIKLALGMAFDAMRNTYRPKEHEMVLLYYVGHGLSVQRAMSLQGQSSSPRLDKLEFPYCPDYFDAAEPFLEQNRTVKGGELCLHDVGFCDLQGLLKPWIAAVKEKSINAGAQTKKNKYLIVIADSCFSGKLVEELQQLATKPNQPWNSNCCTVTVQSASGSNEGTFGGYFTPYFIHLNQRPQVLGNLKNEWNRLSDPDKDAYRQDQSLPSPQVATTMQLNQENDPATVLPTIQGFQLTLFHDAGFFKFCYRKIKQGFDSAYAQSWLKERSDWMDDYVEKMIQKSSQTS